MRNKPVLASVLCLWLGLLPAAVVGADFATLFTTPQERQIINANRYKSDDAPLPEPEPEQTEEVSILPELKEEVTYEYSISGITLSRDGPHTVWINSLAYEDGEELEDSSKIKVVVGDEIMVRITAPDGQDYFGAAGQVLEVTYLAPVRN